MNDAAAPPTAPSGTPPAVSASRSRGRSLAIASLVLGVLGFCSVGVTALVGVILGIIAVVTIKKTQGPTGLAVAGLVVSIFSLVLTPIVVLMGGLFLPTIAAARVSAANAKMMASLDELADAVGMYAVTHDMALPAADRWRLELEQADLVGDPALFVWALAPQEGSIWAFNIHLDGRSIDEIEDPQRTVLLFEVAPGSFPAGGPELLPLKPRDWLQGYAVAFVDGHHEHVSEHDIESLTWDPAGD